MTNALAGDGSETLRSFLDRREREVVHRIAAIRGQLDPLERELAEIRRAKAAVTAAVAKVLASNTSVNALAQRNSNALADTLIPNIPPAIVDLLAANESLTIKQLIIRALTDHFHDGATPAQLRTYISDAYRREITRGSMGPQIARLHEEGVIEQPPGLWNEGKWKLRKPQTRLKDIG
jgi:hypothetical protein